MSTKFQLCLLGEFRFVDAHDRAVSLGRHAQALLALLALARDAAVAREKLAALLWEDRDDEQARHRLRQCLLTVRRALDDGEAAIVASDGDVVRLDTDAIDVDALAFDHLVETSTKSSLERASELYRGELLASTNLRSQSYEEWLAHERHRLGGRLTEALTTLTRHQLDAGEATAAVATARRLAALNSLDEAAHRLVMTACAAAGQRTEALRHYNLLVERLARELATEPSAESRRLADELRQGDPAPLVMGADPVGATADAAPTATLPETVRRYDDFSSRSTDSGHVAAIASAATALARVPNATLWLAAVNSTATALARTAKAWPWLASAIAMVVLVIVAGGVLWQVYLQPQGLPPPDRPSIAVLPFQNLSDDPAQAGFVDGITEDITTALSMISDMFVIASSTALTYKDKPVNIPSAAKEMDVRYVLQGSVEWAGERVRVSAQLVDSLNGYTLWAEQYDREVREIFALRDEITLEIVTALQVEMTEGVQERISLVHGTGNLQAWMLAGQALQLLRRLTREDNAKARALYARAAELDPAYPGAWAGLAWTHWTDARFGWSASGEASMLCAAELARKTLALDPTRPRTYVLLGMLALMNGDHAQALALGEEAHTLSPNGADIVALLALILTYAGDYERSVALQTLAMRLSPNYPAWYQPGFSRWLLPIADNGNTMGIRPRNRP